jgi:hypothetical protein
MSAKWKRAVRRDRLAGPAGTRILISWLVEDEQEGAGAQLGPMRHKATTDTSASSPVAFGCCCFGDTRHILHFLHAIKYVHHQEVCSSGHR